MASNVIGELDMVDEIMVHSDKCTLKELDKLEQEFAKDLVKPRKQGFRVRIWRYIKDENSMGSKSDKKDDITGPQGDTNENIFSQNQKLNTYVVPGFARQIQMSPALQRFHLVNFRLNTSSWKKIGKALNETKVLKAFVVQACNLYQGEIMQQLMTSMLGNTSLEVLDFSDNDLNDDHGEYLT